MVSVTLEIPDEVHSQLLGEALSLGLDLDDFLVARLLPPRLDDVEPGASQPASQDTASQDTASQTSPGDSLEVIQHGFQQAQRIFQHRMMELHFDFLELQRQAVQRTLETVSATGLTGDHHFYIAFRTTAPGVELSESLRASHPETMTIVLEEQFSSLEVDDEGFSVSLWFSGVPQRLSVPYAALLAFVDPSTQFQLSFPDLQLDPEGAEVPGGERQESVRGAQTQPQAAPVAAPAIDDETSAAVTLSDNDPTEDAPATIAENDEAIDPKATHPDGEKDKPATGGNNVISFADFRKPDGRK